MAKKTLSREEAAARAEARRRNRAYARGEDEWQADEEVTESPTPAGPGGSLLAKIFPPAPPLPGKGDPLAGFTYTGRLRPVVSSLWLIPRNLLAGVGMGVFWALAYIATALYAGSIVGVTTSFLSFGALVAAGWFGWQRPWLYGLVAAVVGYILFGAFLAWQVTNDPSANADALAQYLLSNGLLQAAVGAVAGFYGGYLRRRFADPALRAAQSGRNARKR
jgi:predicted membrane protein